MMSGNSIRLPAAARRRIGRLLARLRLMKPLLPYLELHLVDQCNLNCRGCSHFSPLAGPWYADLVRHERDIWQLRKYFRKIVRIRLMGGEPLLHPGVEQFLASTRRAWPTAFIHLVTNGILLRRMPQSFWRTCRNSHIIIDWTVYPPMVDQCESMCDFVAAKGVQIQAYKVTDFFYALNFDGDSDPVQAFKVCRSHCFYSFLREGKLYICWNPALAHYPNRALGTQIPSDGFVDIYAPGMTGLGILKVLHRPARVCRYCSCDSSQFPWARSKGDRSEWGGASVRTLEAAANPSSHHSAESRLEAVDTSVGTPAVASENSNRSRL